MASVREATGARLQSGTDSPEEGGGFGSLFVKRVVYKEGTELKSAKPQAGAEGRRTRDWVAGGGPTDGSPPPELSCGRRSNSSVRSAPRPHAPHRVTPPSHPGLARLCGAVDYSSSQGGPLPTPLSVAKTNRRSGSDATSGAGTCGAEDSEADSEADSQAERRSSSESVSDAP